MVGLDALDAHVVFHDLAGDHDGFYFLEAEQREEALGGGDIAHDNGDVIEVADHGVPLFRRGDRGAGCVHEG
jgi:hypothetical protein